ncbi:hypothetical protein CHELA40_14445 [Chelatococcus asaccharovorans]|nr:hypothetical protein CHELA17_61175 [Chelatococcus asaccharovorans]CAH1677583.1 hypothetical protein CHELA40_14445 [Chelatococcus asaccharovorans]
MSRHANPDGSHHECATGRQTKLFSRNGHNKNGEQHERWSFHGFTPENVSGPCDGDGRGRSHRIQF